MIIKRLLALFAILIISLTPIISSLSVISTAGENNNIRTLEVPDKHIIESVPYVGQETNLYCAYACYTMLLNNFNEINTTLQDIIFYSGIGYSMIYPSYFQQRMPLLGTLASQSEGDIEFLTSLFGVILQSWYPKNESMSVDQYWQEYWKRAKENISNNVPILTSVDPFKLSSFRKLIDYPNFPWNYMPASGHGIVLVGYNQSNQTVCYHDPASALFNHAEYGTYAWMNLSDLNQAILTTTGSKYTILSFKQVSEPLPKQEAFNRSHTRNLEKLRGNSSLYNKLLVNLSQGAGFGINGSKLMQKHFEKGIENRFKTIIIYKKRGKLGFSYKLIKNLAPIVIKLLNLPPDSAKKFTADSFQQIAIEKSWMANFLYNNSNLSDICEYEANLFENEAKHWNKLSSYYSVFKKKGIFLSSLRAFYLMSKMSNTMDKIIEIENAIINLE